MSIPRFCHSVLIMTLSLSACGGDVEAGASSEAPTRSTPTAQPVMGSFELPDTTFRFRVTACDLLGTGPNGILLRGTGTMPDGQSLMPDGRMLLIEVERLTPDMGGPGFPYERATVQFGTLMDEDGWEATAYSLNGSTWTNEATAQAIEGPIIQITENDLVVAAVYGHQSRDESVDGTLRVTCPRPKYP